MKDKIRDLRDRLNQLQFEVEALRETAPTSAVLNLNSAVEYMGYAFDDLEQAMMQVSQ